MSWFIDKDPRKVLSPCNGDCNILNSTGLCSGCSRTLKEVVEWETADDTDRKIILDNCKKRKNEIPSTK